MQPDRVGQYGTYGMHGPNREQACAEIDQRREGEDVQPTPKPYHWEWRAEQA